MPIGKSDVGVTKNEESQVVGFGDELTILIKNVGQHIVHPIGKLRKQVTRWFPVLRWNVQEQNYKASMTSITGESSIFNDVEELDESIRKRYWKRAAVDTGDISDADIERLSRSGIAPSNRYVMLAFDALDAKPVVKRLPLPYSAWEQIGKLQKMESKIKGGNLMYGPLYACHYMIDHSRSEKGSFEAYRHKYSVSIYKAPFTDELPVILLDSEIPEELWRECFTEEEHIAMAACNIDLDNETRALSDDEICDIFSKTPVNLGAVDDNVPFFIDPQAIASKLEELGIGSAFISSIPKPKLIDDTDRSSGPVVRKPEIKKEPKPVKVEEPLSPTIENAKYENIKAEKAVKPSEPTKEKEALNMDIAELGWESEEQMMFVIENFVPISMVEKIKFKSWSDKDLSVAGFEDRFPGRLAGIIESDGKLVESTPEEKAAGKAEEKLAVPKEKEVVPKEEKPVPKEKAKIEKRETKSKPGKRGGRW